MDTDTTEMLWHLLPLGPPLRLAVGAEEVGKSILSKTMIMFMDTDTTEMFSHLRLLDAPIRPAAGAQRVLLC